MTRALLRRLAMLGGVLSVGTPPAYSTDGTEAEVDDEDLGEADP